LDNAAEKKFKNEKVVSFIITKAGSVVILTEHWLLSFHQTSAAEFEIELKSIQKLSFKTHISISIPSGWFGSTQEQLIDSPQLSELESFYKKLKSITPLK
jgi:hypothetical protein